MKRIPIFKAGRHTATNGASLDFSESALRAAVANYDPAIHEAPLVVGHPRDNLPAYGWVKSLDYDEATGEIVALPEQVDAEFADMVAAGRFKKRSASWYLPDAPANPKPGFLYLRHVGFLGAQPPAVKGLRAVEFSDSEQGVVEFADSQYVSGLVARLFRGLREWIIAEKGLETADKIAPDYLIGGLEEESRKSEPAPASMPNYTEEDPMKIQELQAQVARLTEENASLKSAAAKSADFAEREASLAAREQAIAQAEEKTKRLAVEARVDALVKAGKVLPAKQSATIDFAMRLDDGEATIDFSEGAKSEKVSLREAYLRNIEVGPRLVEYSELSADTGTGEKTLAPISEVERGIMRQVASGGAATK